MKDFFCHEQALCESVKIGARTRIWAFAHVLPKATIGADCNICDHVFIENDVVIGDRVTVKCGVQLWDGLVVEDDVFIGPNATFSNDRYPRSRQHLEKYPLTKIEKGASIGANATILPGLHIGANAMIGAGAVVTRSVPPNAIVMGNPGRITGYVGTDRSRKATTSTHEVDAHGVQQLDVKGVTLRKLPQARDLRGSLVALEFEQHVPFSVNRSFVVFGVPNREIRGEHAHKVCHQFLVCLNGQCSVVVDDGTLRQEVKLDDPGLGLHMPPMTWGIQYQYSEGAVLLVLASHHYDPDDYIRDYGQFLSMTNKQTDAS